MPSEYRHYRKFFEVERPQPNPLAFSHLFQGIQSEAEIFVAARLAMVLALSQHALYEEVYLIARAIINGMYEFEHDHYHKDPKQYGNTIDIYRKNISKDIYQIIKDESFILSRQRPVDDVIDTKHHIFPMMRRSWGIPVENGQLKMFYYPKKYNRFVLAGLEEVPLSIGSEESGLIVGTPHEKNIINISHRRHCKGLNEFFYTGSMLIPHQIMLILWDDNVYSKVEQIYKNTDYIEDLCDLLVASPLPEIYQEETYKFRKTYKFNKSSWEE
jgi:hypothetical protein